MIWGPATITAAELPSAALAIAAQLKAGLPMGDGRWSMLLGSWSDFGAVERWDWAPLLKSQGFSCCGVVADGVLRLLGCPLDYLSEPYRLGTAVVRFEREARRLGAWRTDPVDPASLPAVVTIGRGLGTHQFVALALAQEVVRAHTLVSVEDAARLTRQALRDRLGWSCISIDGGQVDRTTGYQTIAAVRREVRGRWWIDRAKSSHVPPATGRRRALWGWASVASLPPWSDGGYSAGWLPQRLAAV